jgi:hypothetical protein
MGSALLVLLVFSGDPIAAEPVERVKPIGVLEPDTRTEPAAKPGERLVVRVEQPLDRDATREWYRELAAKTTKRSRMPVEQAVPQLVALHESISGVEGLSAVEKQRMKVTLRGRIEWYGHRLRKEVAEGERALRREDETANGGGASLAGARSLIDLIQRTVNPPIWDVNGGPAGIGYFAPVQALVVRAPGEVHRQLGGTLNGLRRAGN